MKTATFLKLSGAAAMLGGGLRAISAFIPYDANSVWLEALYGVIDVSFLSALVGIGFSRAQTTNWLEWLALALSLISVASLVGPDATKFGIDFYLLGSLGLLTGLSILSATWLAVPRLRLNAGVWLCSVASVLVGLIANVTVLALLGSVAFGAGFVISGLRLLRE